MDPVVLPKFLNHPLCLSSRIIHNKLLPITFLKLLQAILGQHVELNPLKVLESSKNAT